MELNINSPAYFTKQYGVDDEVYRFYQKVYVFFKDREYSNVLHTIGIVPVVAPLELYDNRTWEESIRFLGNKNTVHIVIRMDFEKYHNADSLEKVEQIKEMILTAVKRIKSKGKFDYERFKEDFMVLIDTVPVCFEKTRK